MLQQFLNSFNPETENDPVFGPMEIHFNAEEDSYYLMKDIAIGEYPERLALTIETNSRNASPAQASLFELIEKNFVSLLEKARSFMIKEAKNSDLDALHFEAESIYIGSQEKNKKHWELSLINMNDGSSYCIIEWDELKPIKLSVETAE